MCCDEIHTRENLVYEETGAIIGFTNLGDVNQRLLDFEHYIYWCTSSLQPARAISYYHDSAYGEGALHKTPVPLCTILN